MNLGNIIPPSVRQSVINSQDTPSFMLTSALNGPGVLKWNKTPEECADLAAKIFHGAERLNGLAGFSRTIKKGMSELPAEYLIGNSNIFNLMLNMRNESAREAEGKLKDLKRDIDEYLDKCGDPPDGTRAVVQHGKILALKSGLDQQGLEFDIGAWIRDSEGNFGHSSPQFSMPEINWSDTPSKILELLSLLGGLLRVITGADADSAYP
jgi:hypothetical protein